MHDYCGFLYDYFIFFLSPLPYLVRLSQEEEEANHQHPSTITTNQPPPPPPPPPQPTHYTINLIQTQSTQN